MQAIREILTVEKGEVTLSLPQAFWGQQVEIIVLPVSSRDEPQRHKKSLQGCLRQYANPELMAREAIAWGAAVNDNDHSNLS